MKEIAIIIPARIGSTRLTKKVIREIKGKPLIERVYTLAKSTNIGDVYVACDSEEIGKLISDIGGKVIYTRPELPRGTDRVYNALKHISAEGKDYKYVINIQGDMVYFSPEIIQELSNILSENKADIVTPISLINDKEKLDNPNIVKVATDLNQDKTGRALYFSRSLIPYNAKQYYEHIGIYGYKVESLKKFVLANESSLEKSESLEQLRALSIGQYIKVFLTNGRTMAIDTIEDLVKAEKLLFELGYN